MSLKGEFLRTLDKYNLTPEEIMPLEAIGFAREADIELERQGKNPANKFRLNRDDLNYCLAYVLYWKFEFAPITEEDYPECKAHSGE